MPPGADAQAAAPTLTRAPALLSRVAAIYPQAEQKAQRDGAVTLSVQIDAAGQVTAVVVTHSGGAAFDAAAMTAVKQFVFSPAEIDGQPAPVEIDYTEHFVFRAPSPVQTAAAKTTPEPAPITLRGRILERASRVPIANAGVIVTPKAQGAGEAPPVITDANGTFAIALGAGEVHIAVRDVAHHPFVTQEVIAKGEELQVTYYLMPKAVGTFETIVRGTREKKEVTRRTLHRAELESVPGSFGDPLRVILDLPGLARTPLSVGGLIIRGSAAADTGTYFDGVQLPLIFHFGGGPSVVNPEFLDRIDFFPGGFGARYGRAIGGVLDIVSRPVKPLGVHGSAKIDLIDTGAFVSVPITDALSVSAAVRRSYVEVPLKIALRATNSASTIVPSYYDYQARLSLHRPASPQQFDVTFMGSDDLLKVVSTPSTGAPIAVNAHQGYKRLSGRWQYQRAGVTHKALLFAGYDDNSFGIGQAKVDSPALVLGAREDFLFALGPRVHLSLGLDAQWRRQGFTIASAFAFDYLPYPGSQPNAPLQTRTIDIGQLDVAEWLELEALLPYRLRIVPSLRFDTYYANGHTQLSLDPRLLVRREFGQSLPGAFKASYGVYTEQPSGRASNSIIGNPKLALQHANQLAVGYEQRLLGGLNVDATLFWSHRYDLAVATSATTTGADGSIKPLFQASTGRGDAYGLELFVRQDLTTHIFGWLAYTLAWSAQRDGLGQRLLPTAYSQRHTLTAIGQYKFDSGWSLGARFRVISGSLITPVEGATYSADAQNYAATFGPINSRTQAVFHQLDIRVDKVWLLNTWQVGLYLDVQNLYNRQNENYVQYDYRFKGSRVLPDVPLLPTLGVKGVF